MEAYVVFGIIILMLAWAFRSMSKVKETLQEPSHPSSGHQFSQSDIDFIVQSGQRLIDIIDESMPIIRISKNRETIDSRIWVVKEKLKELSLLAAQYPFLKIGPTAELEAELKEYEVVEFKLHITLDRRTPLKYLERHGEIQPSIPKEEIPQQFGIWLRMVPEKYRYLSEGATMASAAGPLPLDGGDFLPYLKNVRRIIEAPYSSPRVTIDDFLQKVDQLKSIVSEGKTYSGQSYLDTLFGGDNERILSFVITESGFTFPKGLSIQNILTLEAQGYHTLEEMIAAPDNILLSLPGVGKKTLLKIRSNQNLLESESISQLKPVS